MFVIKHRKIFYSISGSLIALSLFAVLVFGLNFGIDFKGGSIMEVGYVSSAERPDASVIKEGVAELGWTDVLVQPTGDDGYIVRTPNISEEDRLALVSVLSMGETLELEERRFNSVGPVVGEELRSKAWIAIATVIIAIILFIAFVFNQVSKPVSSWKYGVVAIIALVHDIIIPTGIFALLGSVFIDAQVDVLFVMALLAILGFSVNDTIVIFDRIRENLKNKVSKHFDETVGISLKQTITRSINTSLTTLFVLITLFIFGGDSTKNFALVLAIGVISGTYSSIFLASPLLVSIEKWQRTRK